MRPLPASSLPGLIAKEHNQHIPDVQPYALLSGCEIQERASDAWNAVDFARSSSCRCNGRQPAPAFYLD